MLWDRPDLERLYARLEDEYELKERAGALKRKLDVIVETAHALDRHHRRRPRHAPRGDDRRADRVRADRVDVSDLFGAAREVTGRGRARRLSFPLPASSRGEAGRGARVIGRIDAGTLARKSLPSFARLDFRNSLVDPLRFLHLAELAVRGRGLAKDIDGGLGVARPCRELAAEIADRRYSVGASHRAAAAGAEIDPRQMPMQPGAGISVRVTRFQQFAARHRGGERNRAAKRDLGIKNLGEVDRARS